MIVISVRTAKAAIVYGTIAFAAAALLALFSVSAAVMP